MMTESSVELFPSDHSATRRTIAAYLAAARQSRLDLTVRTGNNMRGDQAVTHALTGVGSGTHGRIDRTGFPAHQHGDITAAHEFAPNKSHLSGLGHSIRRLNGGHQPAGLDHA